MNKVALCFIINYEHKLHKEEIWKEWIKPNKDIINIYFFYKDYNKINSEWIKQHAIPLKYICNTSYYHVVPAYISVMNFALKHDSANRWFCFLTDTCCPIIPSDKFRYLFFKNMKQSIMSHSQCYWNIHLHKRANLYLLPDELRLANAPWFILTKEHAIDCINFMIHNNKLFNTICDGGLANESIFAIMLKYYGKLDTVINSSTHITDWSRMTSATSPHIFIEGNKMDLNIIDTSLYNNKYSIFIRKISNEFPDAILRKYIFIERKKYIFIFWSCFYLLCIFIFYFYFYLFVGLL